MICPEDSSFIFSIGIFCVTNNQSGSGVNPSKTAALVAAFKFVIATALVKALLSTFSAHSSAATTLLISNFPGPFRSTLLAQKSAVSFSRGQPVFLNQSLSCVTAK